MSTKKSIDYTDKIFNSLKVLKLHDKWVDGGGTTRNRWVCECIKCGATQIFPSNRFQGKSNIMCFSCENTKMGHRGNII